MEEYWRIKHTVPEEIVKFLSNVFEIYEIRGQVGHKDGIKFIVHTMEQNHAVPHIHAEYGEYQISIALEDQKILAGNLPKSKQQIAQRWVRDHKDELYSKWSNIAISAVSSMTMTRLNWPE